MSSVRAMSRLVALAYGPGGRMRADHRSMYGFRNLVFPCCGPYNIGPCNLSTKSSLPSLPVPALQDTLNKYYKSIKPHLNRQELIITSNIIKEFGAVNGIGTKLQELLEERAHSIPNWFGDWWLHSAYLDYRMPVVVHSNPGHVWPFKTFNSKNDQIAHAARVILAAMDYKKLVDDDLIPQDKMGTDLLDMSQYKKVLGTCRMPGLKRDTLSYNDSKHITVFHNNHIFILNLFGEDGVLMNEEQLIKQLQNIVSQSKNWMDKPVGILTTEHRDTWGNIYSILIKDKLNKKHLKAIEESIFVVSLDKGCGIGNLDKSGKQTVAAQQTIHGGGSKLNSGNRWFDKTVQFVIGEDGINGLTYEHSPAEGQPVAVLVDHIIDYINNGKYANKPSSNKPMNATRMDFNLTLEVNKAIDEAKENIDKLVNSLELSCFSFKMYGKDFIKSQKLSPDSFIQMAIQFAFYRVHRVPGAHYETASTRKYLGGRTETIRSCSEESVHFAESMLSKQTSVQEKVKAMQNAIKAHKDYAVEAMNGQGVDRHLLSLKLIALENKIQIPKFYSDVGFVKSSRMRISSSQVASKCDGFMCFAPLVDDGYATCYNPRASDIVFSTSAFNVSPETSAKKYRQALEDSLTDMHNVLMKCTQSKL